MPYSAKQITVNMGQFKMDHGYKHKVSLSNAASKTVIGRTFHIDEALDKHKINDEIYKPLQSGEISSTQAADKLVSLYMSGDISESTARGVVHELSSRDPELLSELARRPDKIGVTDPNRVNAATTIGLLSQQDGRTIAAKQVVRAYNSRTKNPKNRITKQTLDYFTREIVPFSDKLKSKNPSEKLRDTSAATAKYGAKTSSRSGRSAYRLGKNYGLRSMSMSVGGQMGGNGSLVQGEASTGVKNLAMTAWGTSLSLARGVGRANLLQFRAVRSMMKTTITNKDLLKLQNAIQSGSDRKLKAIDKKIARKADAGGNIRLRDNKMILTAAAGALKETGKGAAIGAGKGIARSPVSVSKLSLRQVNKMASDAFGATDSTISKMYAHSRKTLRYGRRAGRALVNTPRNVKKAVDTTKKVAKGTKKAAQGTVKAARTVARVVSQAVTAVVNAVVTLVSNPIGWILIGIGVFIIIVMVMFSGSCESLTEPVVEALETMFTNKRVEAQQIYLKYSESERYLYEQCGAYGVNTLSTAEVHGSDGETRKFWDNLIYLGQLYGTLSDERADELYGNITNFVTSNMMNRAYSASGTNPYNLMAYLTARYGQVNKSDAENELDLENELGIFRNQYTVSVEVDAGNIVDFGGGELTVDQDYPEDDTDCISYDDNGNAIVNIHDWEQTYADGQDQYWQCKNCGAITTTNRTYQYLVSVQIKNNGFDYTAMKLLTYVDMDDEERAQYDSIQDVEIDWENSRVIQYNLLSYYYGNTDSYSGSFYSEDEIAYIKENGTKMTKKVSFSSEDDEKAFVQSNGSNNSKTETYEYTVWRVYEDDGDEVDDDGRRYTDYELDDVDEAKEDGTYEYWWDIGYYPTHDEDESWQDYLKRGSDARDIDTFDDISGNYYGGTGNAPVDGISGAMWVSESGFYITSTYGWRNIGGGWELHDAIDISASFGTEVLAMFPGEVWQIGRYEGHMDNYTHDGTVRECGNYLIIKSTINYGGQQRLLYVRYQHLASGEPTLQLGDYVEQGGVVGHVGNTGYTTGPHIHINVRLDSWNNGVKIDPVAYFFTDLLARGVIYY